MKRWQLFLTSLLGLLMCCGALPAPGWNQGRGQGFRPYPYAPYKMRGVWKPFDETGKVAQVLTENLEDNMNYRMAVVLDNKTHRQVYVHLGPVWYLERQGFELFPGDVVEVKGICGTEENGRHRAIARELIKGDRILLLRDAKGRPYW
jgi:hypothetical protein